MPVVCAVCLLNEKTEVLIDFAKVKNLREEQVGDGADLA